MSGKFRWCVFGKGNNTVVIIDDRFPEKSDDLSFRRSAMTVSYGGYNWSPAVILPVGERFTLEEAKNRAKVLKDVLNADWVKKQLEG